MHRWLSFSNAHRYEIAVLFNSLFSFLFSHPNSFSLDVHAVLFFFSVTLLKSLLWSEHSAIPTQKSWDRIGSSFFFFFFFLFVNILLNYMIANDLIWNANGFGLDHQCHFWFLHSMKSVWIIVQQQLIRLIYDGGFCGNLTVFSNAIEDSLMKHSIRYMFD